MEPEEPPLAAAYREIVEETGLSVSGTPRALTPIQQKGGKRILCWAPEADLHVRGFRPGLFEMEWPPRSGVSASFPELDRAYFPFEEELQRIRPITHALGASASAASSVLVMIPHGLTPRMLAS